MKPWMQFVLIFAGILLLSAWLSPVLYQILPYKFERIFNRIVMIGTLAEIVFFIRKYPEGWKNWIPKFESKHLPDMWAYFFVGVIVLLSLTVFRFAIGEARWSVNPKTYFQYAMILIKVVGACFLIGFLEEWFFRGVIFQSFWKKWGWSLPASLFCTNLFYSSLHFVGHRKIFIDSTPTFWNGLQLIYTPFLSFADWPVLWPAAFGLFIFGLVLNDLVLRYRSLLPAIGLHAGCVFYVKLDGLFVDFSSTHPLIFGSSKLYDGVLGWLCLLLIWGISLKLSQKKGLVRE